jgi:hypothetical protein
MTREEARLLLEVCRPGRPGEADPRLAEALALLKTDQELATWFAHEQSFDAEIRRSLRALPVPPQLQTAILAGGKVIQQLSWWRLVNWRRVAVCALVLMTGAGFFLFSLNRTHDMLLASREAIQLAEARSTSLVVTSGDLEKIRGFLAKCHAPSDFKVPPRLLKLQIMGCTLVGVQERTAAVICFRIVGNNQFRLFVMERVQDADLPAEGAVRVIHQGDWAAAIWTDKDKTYLLAGKVPPETLRRILI